MLWKANAQAKPKLKLKKTLKVMTKLVDFMLK